MTRPTSVVNGRDRDVIPLLLDVHAVEEPRIIDVTHNKGVMWKGLDYSITKSDISREMSPDCDFEADCRSLPVDDESFDVIVFDPPHLPTAAASVNSSGIQREAYGLTETGDYREGDNINPLFLDFLTEARRVLSRDGVVLAKIADLVHNHRYQWQHVAFINAAEAAGMTACDVVIKCDPAASNLKSSKWKNVNHLRRAHCYWIVVRRDGRCEGSR